MKLTFFKEVKRDNFGGNHQSSREAHNNKWRKVAD